MVGGSYNLNHTLKSYKNLFPIISNKFCQKIGYQLRSYYQLILKFPLKYDPDNYCFKNPVEFNDISKLHLMTFNKGTQNSRPTAYLSKTFNFDES